MLTIVIPSYNHEKYIYECLSAAAQVEINDLKILVIDDGSTDKTPDVVKSFIDEHQSIDIRLVEKENAGLVSSLNLALELVDTDYIYICASDDIPIPAGVKKCYDFLIKNKVLEFCIGGSNNFNIFNSKVCETYNRQHVDFFNTDFTKDESALFLDFPVPLLLQSTVFRKSALESIGGWDPEIKWDDYPTFVKLLRVYSGKDKRGFVFLSNVTVVNYRQHDKNTYLDIVNQFFMVKQAMTKLASSEIRDNCLAMHAAKYMISSIKRFDFKSFFNIFGLCELNVKVKIPYFFLIVIFRKLKKA